MNSQFFSNNRQQSRRSFTLNNGPNNQFARSNRNSMNFTDNFIDFPPAFHNSTMMNQSRASSSNFSNKGNHLSAANDFNSSMISDKSFSSLFNTSSSNLKQNNHNKSSDNSSDGSNNNIYNNSFIASNALTTTGNSDSSNDDDGIYLQISNLDQWYDEASLKHYLMNQLKPITPILSLTIETPSIAKVKVPSMQFAKQVVSHMHRKKMGHKRIFVSFLKDKTSAECSALRNKVIGLLRDVPTHQLPMSKFRELFQSRFKSSISILDLYRMPDICTIGVNEHEEKVITLEPSATKTEEVDTVLKTEQHSAPYCIFHYKADKNKGWAEIEIDPLPNVFMKISEVQTMILPLLQLHQGDIPVASLLYCLEAEHNITVQANERGVSLEHLVSCVPNVRIRNNDFGIKILAWRDDHYNDEVSVSSKYTSKSTINSPCGDTADNISKEVIELIRMCPKSTMQFSKFIPTYHNHFGKQCRVADYGCTKLIEMFEAMSSIVQVLGEGESRQITLTHRVQIRRFSTDVFKILRHQPTKSVYLSNLPQLFLSTHNRVFDVTDYGVCDIQDLLDGLRNNNFILVTKIREQNEDYMLSLQKRRQTNNEMEKTCIFSGEVVELLRNAPQFSIPFRKFVRSYHYYFGYQCKLSDYGFLRLAELLEALSGVVEMDQSNEENRRIYLSRKVALRLFSEQIQDIIKSMAGTTELMIKVDELMEMHKKKYGYQMQGSSLGYDTVIDALKFVPFVELHSYENELWLVSHLDNEKFRQRAMLACIAIVDIGVKVPLSKFYTVFNEKFKFTIHEKTLHAMKHAVDIEMVNGVKMISITPMMKFIMHITNILEQRKIINLQEIKSMLKLNLSTCFNFGYPNLSSLFQAFPDIFNGTKIGTSLHERSDIELVAECPLCPLGLQTLLSSKQIQLPDEKPEIYRTIDPIGYNPNRHLQKSSNVCININGTSGSKVNNGDLRNLFQQQQQQQHSQSYAYCRSYNNNNNSNINNNGNPFSGDLSLQNEMVNNNPYQSYYNQSDEPQGFYERNLKFQQQQQQQQQHQMLNTNNQMQALKRDFWNTSNGSSINSSSSSYSAYDSNLQQQQQQQQFSIMATPYSRFDPPKPDTPPSKPTTIWFDPVWKSDAGMLDSNRNNNNNGNSNTNDSLKAFNVHVVSPFLSFKTMFTFDHLNNSSNNSKM